MTQLRTDIGTSPPPVRHSEVTQTGCQGDHQNLERKKARGFTLWEMKTIHPTKWDHIPGRARKGLNKCLPCSFSRSFPCSLILSWGFAEFLVRSCILPIK